MAKVLANKNEIKLQQPLTAVDIPVESRYKLKRNFGKCDGNEYTRCHFKFDMFEPSLTQNIVKTRKDVS